MQRNKRKRDMCESCNRFDNNDMVQCDDCDLWYHYVCVGVGPEVSKVPWSCISCRRTEISDISLGNLRTIFE